MTRCASRRRARSPPCHADHSRGLAALDTAATLARHEPPAANGRVRAPPPERRRTRSAGPAPCPGLPWGRCAAPPTSICPRRRSMPCGCATVDLDVERGSCPPAPGRGRPIPSEAEVLTDAGAPLGGIIVFLKDGYLSTLEIYSVGPEPIRIWPQLDRLRPTLTS